MTVTSGQQCTLPAPPLSVADWRTYLVRTYAADWRSTSKSRLDDTDRDEDVERLVARLDVVNLTTLAGVSAAARSYAEAVVAHIPREASWTKRCYTGTCHHISGHDTRLESARFISNLNIHCPLEMAWRPRVHRRRESGAPGGGFAKLPGSSWVEVTHCGGSDWERSAPFFYAARGSGLWIYLGKTAAFAAHEHAVQHFLQRKCSDPKPDQGLLQCDNELEAMAEAARQRGFDTIQFTRHCDAKCELCLHEIVVLRAGERGTGGEGGKGGAGGAGGTGGAGGAGGTGCTGGAACPHIEYRRGLRAQWPCQCVPHSSSVGTSWRPYRGACATCAPTAAGHAIPHELPPSSNRSASERASTDRATSASVSTWVDGVTDGGAPHETAASAARADATRAACDIERARAAKYRRLQGGSSRSHPPHGAQEDTGDAAPRVTINVAVLARRLALLLHQRGTLCSEELPCTVRVVAASDAAGERGHAWGSGGGGDFEVCLPALTDFETGLRGGGVLCQASPVGDGFSLRKSCARGTAPRCFQYNSSRIQQWVAALRARADALRRGTKSIATVNKAPMKIAAHKTAAARVPTRLLGRRLPRCAMVMSGHSLKCAERPWSGRINGPHYDLVLRANTYPSMGPAGNRTDVAYRNCASAPATSDCLTKEWLASSGLREAMSRARVGTGLGSGHSGGAVMDVAVAFCDRLDVFGMGLFSRGPGHDLIYQHFYDPHLTSTCIGPCLAAAGDRAKLNVSDAEQIISARVCKPFLRCDMLSADIAAAANKPDKAFQWGFPQSERPDDFFFLSELRVAVLAALGVINWIWY